MHYLEATHCEEGETEVQRMRIQHPKIHQTSESCQVERRSLGLTGVSVEGSASPDVNCGETTRRARPPQLLPDLCWLLASDHRWFPWAVPRLVRSLFSSTGNSWDMDCHTVVSCSVVSESLRPHGL